MPWKLKRVRQCKACPWKVGAKHSDIPGYVEAKHHDLAGTIAEPGSLNDSGRVFACHESEPGKEAHCVGWLHHQLGVGNNIPLRIQMLSCENARALRVYGPQHQTFEDTLP